MDLQERCVRYMHMIQCRYCADHVYPIEHEDETRKHVAYMIQHEGLSDIEGLRACVERTCGGCMHTLTKDD